MEEKPSGLSASCNNAAQATTDLPTTPSLHSRRRSVSRHHFQPKDPPGSYRRWLPMENQEEKTCKHVKATTGQHDKLWQVAQKPDGQLSLKHWFHCSSRKLVVTTWSWTKRCAFLHKLSSNHGSPSPTRSEPSPAQAELHSHVKVRWKQRKAPRPLLERSKQMLDCVLHRAAAEPVEIILKWNLSLDHFVALWERRALTGSETGL